MQVCVRARMLLHVCVYARVCSHLCVRYERLCESERLCSGGARLGRESKKRGSASAHPRPLETSALAWLDNENPWPPLRLSVPACVNVFLSVGRSVSRSAHGWAGWWAGNSVGQWVSRLVGSAGRFLWLL